MALKSINRKLKYRISGRRRGMSLIEIVVAVGLSSILTVLVSRMLVQGTRTYRIDQQSIDLQNKTAQVMREFEYSTRAATSIITAESNQLSFYRYYDLSSLSPTLVHYFVSGNQFKVGNILPAGTPPNVTYPAEDEKIVLLVDNLANPNLIFTYYDDLNQALSQPVAPNAVKLIELNISLDKDLIHAPIPIMEQTKVNLRNMKKNL